MGLLGGHCPPNKLVLFMLNSGRALERFYLCYNKHMDAPRPVDSPTVRTHKHQLTWQILAPIVVTTVLILVAAVFFVTSTGSTTRTWADVSIIWLIAPMLIFALLFVIVLGFLIYGIARLLQITPRYTGKAQNFFAMFSGWTRKIADGAAKPFVWFGQAGAILKAIFKL